MCVMASSSSQRRKKIVDAIPVGTTFSRGWDFAGSNDEGDWTCGMKIGKMPDGRFIISGMARFQEKTDAVEVALVNTASLDGRFVRIRMPQDPGQAGKAQAARYTRLLAGYTVVALPVSGDKSVRAEGYASQVNAGNVVMLRASWNDVIIDEMQSFPNGKHDDTIDAGADAFNDLTGGATGADALLAHLKKQYESQQREAA